MGIAAPPEPAFIVGRARPFASIFYYFINRIAVKPLGESKNIVATG
jgi:hypothetical protein